MPLDFSKFSTLINKGEDFIKDHLNKQTGTNSSSSQDSVNSDQLKSKKSDLEAANAALQVQIEEEKKKSEHTLMYVVGGVVALFLLGFIKLK
jgi:hypothetical protein